MPATSRWDDDPPTTVTYIGEGTGKEAAREHARERNNNIRMVWELQCQQAAAAKLTLKECAGIRVQATLVPAVRQAYNWLCAEEL